MEVKAFAGNSIPKEQDQRRTDRAIYESHETAYGLRLLSRHLLSFQLSRFRLPQAPAFFVATIPGCTAYVLCMLG